MNYEKMDEDKFQVYRYEMFLQAFEKLADKDHEEYEGTWNYGRKG